MSWLRASRTVVGPDGRAWEPYVTRTRIGAWKGMETPDADLTFGNREAEILWVLVPVMVVLELLLGLLELLALLPLSMANVATRRSLRVEALVEYPVRETYAWTVERAALAHVLDEIAAGLERGSIVRPADARYLGELDRGGMIQRPRTGLSRKRERGHRWISSGSGSCSSRSSVTPAPRRASRSSSARGRRRTR